MTLAAVVGAHGVRGEVRLKLFAVGVESLRRHRVLGAGGCTLTLTALRDAPTGPVARFAEVADRDAAQALRGTELTVPRAALPDPGEGEVYVADLIGLPARVGDTVVGSVVAVENYGAGDLIEVALAEGGRALVPFARCEPGDGWIEIDAAFLD